MKLIAVVLLAAAAATPPEIRYFKYQRAVQVPGNASGQTCVAVDAAMFEHSANGLDDLRLYRGGTETPYVWKNARQVSTAAESIAPINAGRREGKVVFDAQMPEGMYSDVTLDMGGTDFLATVTVFGGQAPERIKTRIGTYTVFDFTAQKLGRSTVLHLPQSNFRWLHFEIAGPVETGQVKGIVADRAALEEALYVAVGSGLSVKTEEHETVVEFTTPANVPVDRIGFKPAWDENANFNREVRVIAVPQVDAPVNWMGSILRVHRVESGQHVDAERLVVDTPGNVFRQQTKWTVTVANGDDVPVRFSSILLEMQLRYLCFEAVPDGKYTLYYGDAVLTAPKYDYATWFVPRADSSAAALGPEVQNARYEQRPDVRPFTEKHPALLWIALLAVVAILAAIALRSVKREPKSSSMP